MDYKYRSIFTSIAKIITPSEEDRFVAKASLAPLKHLMPSDLNPDDAPDMLFFSCNGAVAGLANKNGDAVANIEAIQINKTAKNKYISTDHDREKVVGVILHPGFSKFGTNEPLSEAEAAALAEPFNMAFVGALWKAINPMLSKYIHNTGGTQGEDELSMSWEIAFNSYNIGVGSRNIFDAQIIEENDSAFASYDRCLRCNGGSGRDSSGKEVFRILTGDPIILGYSIVPNPAAEVKGILPIENAPEEKSNASLPPSHDIIKKKLEDIISKDTILQKNAEINITSASNCVNTNITNNMKIENLEQLEKNWTEIRKLETAAAVSEFIKAIQDGSEAYVKQLEAKENLVRDKESARAELEKRASELESSLASVKKELDEIRERAIAVEANQAFNERMSAFDEEFELDDAERKIIASKLKDLDETGFAAYMSECKVMMKEKCKATKKKKAEDDQKKADEDAKAAEEKRKSEAAQAIASVQVSADQTHINDAGAHVIVNKELITEFGIAFGDSMKIDGESVNKKYSKKK